LEGLNNILIYENSCGLITKLVGSTLNTLSLSLFSIFIDTLHGILLLLTILILSLTPFGFLDTINVPKSNIFSSSNYVL